jgi:hypothetical protein
MAPRLDGQDERINPFWSILRGVVESFNVRVTDSGSIDPGFPLDAHLCYSVPR